MLSQSVLAAPGVVVLAGGGPEGDIGMEKDWSYTLYKKLIDNGDMTKDGKIKVVVLSLDKPDTNFMVDYLKSMGATSSENLVISSKKAANDPKLVKTLADADVLFIRGGNQGKAYQLWKDTKLHEQIKALADRGGAIGGTSSGSMGLSQYSMTGGQDFTSKDVMQDSHSPLLNDKVDPSVSGIHNDFLNLVPGVIVDTHCGERARLGRILAVQAKAIEDYKDDKIVGICLEEKTGLVVKDGKAEVFGTGVVHFTQETEDTKVIREPGKALVYTDIRNDALTQGWTFDLNTRLPDLKKKPESTKSIRPVTLCGMADDKLSAEGSVVTNYMMNEPEKARNLFIANDAHSDFKLKTGDRIRGLVQTRSLVKLSEHPESSIVFLDANSKLEGIGDNRFISLKKSGKEAEVPSLILDCQYCSFTSTSPYLSNQDDGSQTLRSAGMVNMRVHVISKDVAYNVKDHKTSYSDSEALGPTCEEKGKKKVSKFLDDQQKILTKMICK